MTKTVWDVYPALRLPLTTFFGRAGVRATLSPPEFCEHYLVERILYQLAHHREKHAQALRLHRIVRQAFLVCTLTILTGATAAIVLLALQQSVPIEWPWQLLVKFAPVYLPIVSAALLVLPNLNDLNRRCTTYGSVVEKLAQLGEHTRRLIDDSGAPMPMLLGVPVWHDSALREIFFRNRLHALVFETERVLLTEVVEFQSFCKHAEVGA